jgi:UDP-N-acetylglucosamine--N-acetylmuramyl-(pentapeptide) pyrophosphoryl-undecaprenol N-acetylglucosamine transferase
MLVVAGKSGGHIFPALSFLEAAEEKFTGLKTLLVLPRKNMLGDKTLPALKVSYLSVTLLGLAPNKQNLKGLLNFAKGFLESAVILADFKPDIVVGFGSIVSLPLVLMAWLFRIRIILHEQNVLPGRANRLLLPCAERIAVSFSETKEHLKDYQRKTVLTGNPLRKRLAIIPQREARGYLGLAEDKFTILVMGGSQGSRKINTQFLQCVSLLENKDSFQLIHLSGSGDYAMLEGAYRSCGIGFRLFSFLEEAQYAYSAADLVIARSGAMTISELIFFQAPAVLIPYPYAYRHQLANAQILSRRGSAVILEESSLTAAALKERIQSLAGDPAKLGEMRQHYKGVMPQDAGRLLAELVSDTF